MPFKLSRHHVNTARAKAVLTLSCQHKLVQSTYFYTLHPQQGVRTHWEPVQGSAGTKAAVVKLCTTPVLTRMLFFHFLNEPQPPCRSNSVGIMSTPPGPKPCTHALQRHVARCLHGTMWQANAHIELQQALLRGAGTLHIPLIVKVLFLKL
jgi:hypothetical protein